MASSNENIFRVTGLCAGNSPVTGEFPAQRPVTRALMFSLICAWINSWVNNGDAGNLRSHRSHYDVIVMIPCDMVGTPTTSVMKVWAETTYLQYNHHITQCSDNIIITRNAIWHGDDVIIRPVTYVFSAQELCQGSDELGIGKFLCFYNVYTKMSLYTTAPVQTMPIVYTIDYVDLME